MQIEQEKEARNQPTDEEDSAIFNCKVSSLTRLTLSFPVLSVSIRDILLSHLHSQWVKKTLNFALQTSKNDFIKDLKKSTGDRTAMLDEILPSGVRHLGIYKLFKVRITSFGVSRFGFLCLTVKIWTFFNGLIFYIINVSLRLFFSVWCASASARNLVEHARPSVGPKTCA